VSGLISTRLYSSRKIRLVSVNKRLIRDSKLHRAIETELKASHITPPLSRDIEARQRQRSGEFIMTAIDS